MGSTPYCVMLPMFSLYMFWSDRKINSQTPQSP